MNHTHAKVSPAVAGLRRLFGRLLAVAVTASVGLLLSPAGPANAVLGVDLVCTTAFQFNFSPALDNNTVHADGTANIVGCQSPNGSQRRLQSGLVTGTPGALASGCSPAPLYISGTTTINWNTGAKSKLSFVVSTDPASGSLGLSAAITGGPMNGDTVTAVPVIVSQDGLCGLGGVRSLTAHIAALTFTH